MNAKQNKQTQTEKLAELLNQADKLSPVERQVEFLAERGVRVVERAEWIKDETYAGSSKEIYKCSHCGHWQSVKKTRQDQIMYMNFCPFCGAWMKSEEEA